MFKRYCDVCGKAVRNDFVSIEFHREKTSGYKHFDVCARCWSKGKKTIDMLEKWVALVESKIRH